MELAVQARLKGASVTVLEAGPRLLGRAVPAEIASVIEQRHRREGVDIFCGAKITHIDAAGNTVVPDKPNGVKFELFVFDALPFASNPVVIETERAEDFSPVKNAEGVDSPLSCKQDQLKQAARWLKELGEVVPVDAQGLPLVSIEISPFFGYDFFSFKKRWSQLKQKPSFSKDLYLS